MFAPGSKAFEAFQAEMRQLLEGLKTRGTPADGDQDIGAQLYRAMMVSVQLRFICYSNLEQSSALPSMAACRHCTATATAASAIDQLARCQCVCQSTCSLAGCMPSLDLQETHGVDEARVLSEIGILFVEGFETTGHTTSWTLFNIATVPGEWQFRAYQGISCLSAWYKQHTYKSAEFQQS